MEIKSAGGLRDLSQSLFVQLRFYDLTCRILNKARFTIFAADRNQRTRRSSHADREDSHTCISGGFGIFNGISAQLLAIGENNERAISYSAFAETLRRKTDSRRYICAAFRNGLRIEIID